MNITYEYYISLISMAVLSIQIAYDSVLFQRWKKILFVKNNALETFYANIRKKNIFTIILLLPIISIIHLFVKVNLFYKEVADCAYCTSMWLGILMGIVFGLPIHLIIIFAPLTILGVWIFEKLIK